MPLLSREEYLSRKRTTQNLALNDLLELGATALNEDSDSFSVLFDEIDPDLLKEILPEAIKTFKDSGFHLISKYVDVDKQVFLLRLINGE